MKSCGRVCPTRAASGGEPRQGRRAQSALERDEEHRGRQCKQVKVLTTVLKAHLEESRKPCLIVERPGVESEGKAHERCWKSQLREFQRRPKRVLPS